MRVVRRLDTGDDASETASVVPVVAGWALGGFASVTALIVALGVPVAPVDVTFLLVVALAIAAETAVVQLSAGRSALSLSLLECVVVVGLLLLHPVSAVLAVLTGIAVIQTVRRIGVQKVAFNLGQHAVAASAAAAIMATVPAAPVASSPRLAAAMVGVLVYSLVNAVALAGVFARLGLVSFREQLTRRPGFLLATSVGNASVGAIVVALWESSPTTIWIVVGPLLALYLSYGSNFRIESLLSEVSTERDHLDRVVTGVQEGIVLLDADGVVRLWNPAMVRITGRSAADAIGRTAAEVLTGADVDGTVVDPSRPLRDNVATVTDLVGLTDAHGEGVETRIVHTLVADDRGRLAGDVVLVQDLSREREATALKEDFVARVSHELRTPLSPLRGYAQLMLRDGDRIPAEKRTEIFTTMVERVGHLERLIDDLLLVSKVGAGEAVAADEVSCEATDVVAVARRMADWVGRDHPDRQLRVSITDTARGDGSLAWADPLRVSQVLTNLIKNACKYATIGTPIDIDIDRQGQAVRVEVRDRGPGIPDDKLEAIFDRFQRLEDPQRMTTNGLGLGLYIARHLTAMMDGRLDVMSQRGVGSSFVVTLPAASVRQVDHFYSSAPALASGGSRVHRRPETLPAVPSQLRG